eukprot:TRINITY_DN7220_c0_g1_i5.p1 TRINITY_DN7220_c0_g1~~TRINITY_DN7220_c0_g1_i5.p1  ORF type:complete len:382 (+),score=41.44 TRINITY_DN7220_c0_g1_i5:116-1261(+)
MQPVCDVRSARSKGLCFHPVQPWIASSLISGQVVIFNYETSSLVGQFASPAGKPVRAIDFHPVDALRLMATGGDDGLVIVRDSMTYVEKHVFMHCDFVRTVQFHAALPWLLSCADDMGSHIWDWRTGAFLVRVTGPTHYVMCARFHPNPNVNLFVWGSLDKTVRLTDFEELRRRAESGKFDNVLAGWDCSNGQPICQAPDEVCTAVRVFQGHTHGVNSVAFHPYASQIVSGSDDKTVRIWQYELAGMPECVAVFPIHSANVSAALFHPLRPAIISAAEDCRLLISDQTFGQHRVLVEFGIAGSRMWTLATHPSGRLLAAGHDKGFSLFTLDASVRCLSHCSSFDSDVCVPARRFGTSVKCVQAALRAPTDHQYSVEQQTPV